MVRATATRQIRIARSVKWFPQKLTMPIATNDEDLIRASLSDLHTAMTAPITDTPSGTLPETLYGELTELTQCLVQHIDQEPQLSLETLTKMLGQQPTEEPAPPLGVAPGQPWHPDLHIPPGFAGAVTHPPDTGAPAEYKDLIKSSQGEPWEIAMCKEHGRLFQGYVCPNGEHTTQCTDTCAFIKRHETVLVLIPSQ
jgi:hypothetical protein